MIQTYASECAKGICVLGSLAVMVFTLKLVFA